MNEKRFGFLIFFEILGENEKEKRIARRNANLKFQEIEEISCFVRILARRKILLKGGNFSCSIKFLFY